MTDKMQSKIIDDLTRYVPQVVIPVIIAFISVPIYTRMFNPAAYGNFNLVRVSINLLERCSNWIGCSMTRYYNEYEKDGRLDVMLTSILKTNFIIAIFVTIPTLILLEIVPIEHQLKLLSQLGIITFSLLPTGNALRNVLRMQRRIKLHSVFILTTNIFSFLLSIALIFFVKMDIEAIFLGNLIVVIIALPFLWKYSVNKTFLVFDKIDFIMIKRFVAYGVPLTVGVVGLWVLDFSDRYIIKVMLGSYDVGIYSACYNITWNSLFLLVHLFYMMEEPLAMKIYVNEGAQALKKFISCEARIFILLIVPCLLLMCAHSRAIFSFLVASEYQSGAALVPYVSLSVMLIGLIYKFNLGIMAREKTRILMYIVITSGVSNILFNIFLIPRMGILGAGLATLLSYALYFAMIVVASSRIFPWPFPFISLVRTAIAGWVSVVVPAAVFGNGGNLVRSTVYALLSLVLYVLFLILTREIKQVEMDAFVTYASHSMRGVKNRLQAVRK